MQVSILINTAREDFSLVAYPTVHLFEWTLASLRNQTQKDFEVVIADALYDKRPNYFKEHPEVFPVTHVPVKPNVWSPRGVCAISTAKNTCLLHAKGEYGVFLDDCAWVDEYFIQRTVDWIKRGNVVSSLYEVYEGEKLIYPNRSRAFTLGHSVNNLAMKMTDWEFFNGYDEMYDGAKCLEDCDLSNRVIHSGKTLFRIAPLIKYQHHADIAFDCRRSLPTKCNHLWAMCAGEREKAGIFAANTIPITSEEFAHIKSCNKNEKGFICPYVKLPCNFISPEGKAISGANEEMMELYKHPSLTFSLKEQRQNVTKALEVLNASLIS